MNTGAIQDMIQRRWLGKHVPNPLAHYLLLCDLLISSDVKIYLDQHCSQPIDPTLAATAKTDYLNCGQLTPIEINAIGFLNMELENRVLPTPPVRLITRKR
jgi:hypothetical protein